MADKVYLEGSVAGVTLQSTGGDPLKASLVGRGNLVSGRAVNNRAAASGTLYTQSFPLAVGVQFGVRFEFIPPDVFNEIVDAINAAIDSQTTFSVDVADDISEVAVEAVVAGTNWLELPDDQRTNSITIKGPVIMRFLTAGPLES